MGPFRYGLKIANGGAWYCSCGFRSDFLSVSLLHLFNHATDIMINEKKPVKVYTYKDVYDKAYVFQTEYQYELHEMKSAMQYGIDFGYRFDENKKGSKALPNNPMGGEKK